MSPRRTFTSCGSSSSDRRRSTRPRDVTRGSLSSFCMTSNWVRRSGSLMSSENAASAVALHVRRASLGSDDGGLLDRIRREGDAHALDIEESDQLRELGQLAHDLHLLPPSNGFRGPRVDESDQVDAVLAVLHELLRDEL